MEDPGLDQQFYRRQVKSEESLYWHYSCFVYDGIGSRGDRGGAAGCAE